MLIPPSASATKVGVDQYKGVIFGKLDVNNDSDSNLTLNKVIGDRNGYASVDAAIKALSTLTAGAPASAAIMDAGSLYFGVTLRDHYGAFELGSNRNQRAFYNLNSNARAVVEGGTSILIADPAKRVEIPKGLSK
jgi:hypothetical protein